MASEVEALILSGGEPFNHPLALRYALAACDRGGKTAVVCTSGFWARSGEEADRLLGSYPPFGMLLLSTDVYHEEFVSLDHVRHAAQAALTRGIELGFQVVDGPSGSTSFLERFRAALGDDLATPERIYVTRLSLLGRATKDLSDEEKEAAAAQPSCAPDLPCPWLGTPWLREDGVVAACPNLGVFQAPEHALHLGHLDREDFAALSARADDDPLIQLLRTVGPIGISRMFPVQAWGWRGEVARASTICDVCHSLMATDGLPERLRVHADKRQLRALRILVHSEVGRPRSCGEAPEP